ncbi:MAG TPA: hypothetical protein DDZ80_23940 [Cyanobacteria bacterium UBA8803]|nr:hypothetical protein [Cyanobacteria bacterium UBA9273]HBL61367.1 hypothetical protein [Cyanobacteria bacterium UBA8803]
MGIRADYPYPLLRHIHHQNQRTRSLQQGTFPYICPDFVVELRSSSDTLSDLQGKMREYMENGARLGWLLDPKHRRVEVSRPGQEVEVLENPVELSGEDVLPGFILNLNKLWG